MNDAILLDMSQKNFQKVVDQTFKLCRTSRQNGDLLALADSALAETVIAQNSR